MRKVMLVEDHVLVASAVAAVLSARGYEVEQCPPRSRDGILRAVRQFAPEVIVLDDDLGPEVGSGLPLIPTLCETGAHVLMLTAGTDRARLAAFVEAGAAGFLSKGEPFGHLVRAIERVSVGEALLSASERDELRAELRRTREEQRRRRAPFEQLTQREQEVLVALIQGSSARAIAEQSFTSIRTVRGHIQSVLDKLEVSSQLSAVVKAREADWPAP